MLLVERRLVDGLKDRPRSGRSVLPPVVTDLTPQMQLQGLECLSLQPTGFLGKLARPCQGGPTYLRKGRTIYGPQAAIFEI